MKSLMAAICGLALIAGLNDAYAASKKSKKGKARQAHSKTVKKTKAAKTKKVQTEE